MTKLRIGCSGWNYKRWDGWRNRGIDVCACFNNDCEGCTIANALGLKKRPGLS